MERKAKLRFGVFCRELRLCAWEAEAIRKLLVSDLAEPVVVVKELPDPETKPWSARTILYRLYDQLWLRRRSRALAEADFTEWMDDIEVIEWPVQPETLSQYRLDFAIRFGAGALPADLLTATRFGVWSFDQASEPATPACFWEVARGESRTEVSLARLADGEGASSVLHRGAFGTCKASWVNNLDQALLGAADFCARVCAQISTQGLIELSELSGFSELAGTPRTGFGRGHRIPTNGEFVSFLARAATHLIRKAWELLFHLEVWNVGFSKDRLEEIVQRGQIDHSGITWCEPHRSGAFIADPFGHGRDGQEHILVEEFDEGDRGRICRLARPRAGRPLELDVEIEEPYHMSYPCLFGEEGQLYCVPETYQANGARLYQLSDGRWDLVRTIVEGQPIVDPTLFRHANHYWLLCTLQNDGAWGNLKLHGYYSEGLTSVWKPHPLNPLKCDIGSCRPAGRPVEIDGALYRPSQDCSDTYGGAVVINRVVKLSPTEFSETVAATIRPLASGPYPHGLHTMNGLADGTVIDGKRFTFDLRAWRINRGRLHEVFR